MAWPREHKAATRARIIEAAAAEFRAHGASGAGVADIMKRAGLTHGGFYAHFSSKSELLAEALERAARETYARLTGGSGSISPKQRFDAIVDRYLSPDHAAHPDRGCPIAGLAAELARADRGTRRQLARSIRSRLEWLREASAERQSGQLTEEQVAGALACMVGGVVLARGLGGAEGEVLLESCRSFLRGALGL